MLARALDEERRFCLLLSVRCTLTKVTEKVCKDGDRRASCRSCVRIYLGTLPWGGTLSRKFWNFKSRSGERSVLPFLSPMLVAVVASRSRFDVIFMFFSLRSGIVVELLTRSSRAYASLWGYSGDGEDFGGIFRSIGPTEWCRFVVVARSAHVASRRRQPRRHSARPFVPRDDRRWFVAGLSREQFPDFYVRRPEDGARRLRSQTIVN